jgi:hypothetical protein
MPLPLHGMRMPSSTAVHSHLRSRTVSRRWAYHHLSEAEHGWNYTRQLLDITREEVDIYTHRIIHLEHVYEMQGAKFEERMEMIAHHDVRP